MIEQKDLPEYIEQSIPELSGICKTEHCNNAYDIAKQMIKYTSNQFSTKNMAATQKCLALAEKLYNSGSKAVKNAIENVFVYSFSHSFFHDEEKRQNMLSILPNSLYMLYKKQLISSHL